MLLKNMMMSCRPNNMQVYIEVAKKYHDEIEQHKRNIEKYTIELEQLENIQKKQKHKKKYCVSFRTGFKSIPVQLWSVEMTDIPLLLPNLRHLSLIS